MIYQGQLGRFKDRNVKHSGAAAEIVDGVEQPIITERVQPTTSGKF